MCDTKELVEPNEKSLGDRMKDLEKKFDMQVSPLLPFIIRLDGKNFSKYTRGFHKPFDSNFIKAMVCTMNHLVLSDFKPISGYCHSDEITLIFPPLYREDDDEKYKAKRANYYNGRALKLCSLAASKASLFFNKCIRELVLKDEHTYTKEFVAKILQSESNAKPTTGICTKSEPEFDARIMEMPSAMEVANHMLWRNRDCYRNCVFTCARAHFSNKKLHGKNSDMMISMMNEINAWENIPYCWLCGVYSKRYSDKVTKNFCFEVAQLFEKDQHDKAIAILLEPYNKNLMEELEIVEYILF